MVRRAILPPRVMVWLLLAAITWMAFVTAPRAAARARPADRQFTVEVRGADPDLRDETIDIITKAATELKARSGVGFRDTVHVFYVLKGHSFDSIAGGRFPDWGVGVALADRNLIALRSPRDYPIADQLAKILRHELAHLHLEMIMARRRPPRWMHEGYAQQFAHQWNYEDDFKVARAVLTNNELPLADIDGVNSFQGARAELAYLEAYLAMDYFLRTYGWDGLMLLSQSMQQKDDWDAAFMAATGADYASFQEEFETYLRKRFNWATFLGDTVLFWIGIVIAFVVLYFIKRRRSAAKLDDWEEKESMEEILYAPLIRPIPPPRPPESGD